MDMSKEERRVYAWVKRRQYAAMRRKKARTRVLDDYCAVTGVTRKHAIKSLSPARRPPRRRGRPPGGTREGAALLARLWRLSGMMCGKLLRAVLPELLSSLGRREAVPDAAAREVLGMSASTLDRRLRAEKARAPARWRRRASLDEHRREIPLKVDVWPEAYPKGPGYAEVDTVAHCGGSMAGSFVWTLTVTDVALAWAETESVWNKGAEGVCAALGAFIRGAPFRVLALNSDNGGEFINAHLRRHFREFLPGVQRTRSRSYRKNDNAHVEQKNAVRVRALYGHGRIADPALIPLMNRINKAHSLLMNLYTPTMRLLSKERAGSKTVKRYEKVPMTPAQRVLASPAVTEGDKGRVRRMLAGNDYMDLRGEVDAGMKELSRRLAAAAPSGATRGGRPGRPADAPGPRPPASATRGRAAALPLKPPPTKNIHTFGVVFN
jgi:hypothetical protein